MKIYIQNSHIKYFGGVIRKEIITERIQFEGICDLFATHYKKQNNETVLLYSKGDGILQMFKDSDIDKFFTEVKPV